MAHATIEAMIKLRKVRGGDGVNHDFGRVLCVGEEVEATVDLAARCIMGREFELVNEADRDRVDAALRILRGEYPAPASAPPSEPEITTPPTPETGDDPASEPIHRPDADGAGNHAAADPVNVYSEAADAVSIDPEPAESEGVNALP